MEEQFAQAWSRVSQLLLEEHGSLGSRLHRGEDDIWYSYAQWPSEEKRNSSAALPHVDLEARAKMNEAVAESLPDIVLASVSDFLAPIPRAT